MKLTGSRQTVKNARMINVRHVGLGFVLCRETEVAVALIQKR